MNRRRSQPTIRILSLFFLLVCNLSLAAQRPSTASSDGPGFTLEQVLSIPFPSGLVAAPSGARIAWVSDAEGIRNIWGAEGPDFKPRPLTSNTVEDGQELTDLQFTADGSTVVYIRGGDKNSAGEVPNPTSQANALLQQVWAIRWEGGVSKLLGEGNSALLSPKGDEVVFIHGNDLWTSSASGTAPAKPLFEARGNSKSPQWSPDGRKLAFVSMRTDHSFIALYEKGKDSIRFLAASVDRDSTPRWSPDGSQIAFIRQPGRGSDLPSALMESPDPWSIWIADVETGNAKEIWSSPRDLSGSIPRLSGPMVLQWAANRRVVFTSEQDGWNHFYSLPSSGGSPTMLTPGAFEVEQARLSPDRKFIVYSSNQGDIDRRQLWVVSVEGGPPQQLTRTPTIAWNPSITGDSKFVAYLASDAYRPAMPHVSALSAAEESGQSDKLSFALPLSPRLISPPEAMKEFPAAKLIAPVAVMFKAADGLEIHGQLFLPKTVQQGEKLPAILFMHGGPSRQMLLGWHYMYYYHNAYGMNQYLASRGYAVLSVNYRGGIGYGHEFRMAPKRGGRGASEYQDIVAAAEYLKGRPEIDASRVGLWGGSYGGYLTALGLARNSDLFAVGVDLHGVHDWSARASRFGGANAPDSGEARKIAWASSPVSAIPTWKSPVLLIQGDDDRNVAFSQMVDLVQRLRDAKVPFEQIVFPDEVHDFLLHHNWLNAYHAAADFFDRYLKGAKGK